MHLKSIFILYLCAVCLTSQANTQIPINTPDKLPGVQQALATSLNNIALTNHCNQNSDTKKSLTPLLNQILQLKNDSHKVALLNRFGRVLQTKCDLRPDRSIHHPPSTKPEILKLAYQAFQAAASLSNTLDDKRSKSYALGYTAQLYEVQKRYKEALRLTQQAKFLAQEIDAPDILYLWQWQTGRLFNAQGHTATAITAYQQALHNLENIRLNFNGRYSTRSARHNQAMGNIALALADLLLQHARSETNGTQKQATLRRVMEVVELQKITELQDYFKDECMIAFQEKSTRLDKPFDGTAIIYPIILPTRLELLVSSPLGISQYTTRVTQQDLTETLRGLRLTLELQSDNRLSEPSTYLPPAQKLYHWLIEPIKQQLSEQNIDTLVIIPDGALRTIPLAALHDGDHFLIEQFAIATTPGLILTEAKPFPNENLQVLLAGLSDPVQGWGSLPATLSELHSIDKIYSGDMLINKDFVNHKIESALNDRAYGIIHMASHGTFSSNPEETFILTYDGKLTIKQLQQLIGLSKFRDEPVELLTLSACQTAVGDDRAALGLAGIAYQAGARSVLATLWLIGDDSTYLLMEKFYHFLKTRPGLSKTKALQAAQLHLLKNPLNNKDGQQDFRHPYFWSPFLLIGNWL